MSNLTSFVCTTCGKSLLLEARIMLDPKDRQYCVKCWSKHEKEKVTKLGKRFPVGSRVVWMNEDIARASQKNGTVVKCSDSRIQIKTEDGRYKWLEEDSIYSVTPPKK